MSCAVEDCERPDCAVCGWGRVGIASDRNAATQEPMRDDARADFKEKRKPNPTMPKKRHRVGPHR